MKNIVIIGASSTIAQKYSEKWAKKGAKLFLVARNREKLQAISNDLKIKGASSIEIYCADLTKNELHQDILQKANDFLGDKIDVALIAHGTLPNQEECEKSLELTLQEFSNNCLSTVSLLTLLGNKFEEQKSGTIAVISSVAGDRGRASNYVYGSAKSALTVFCSGLRARLSKVGANVLTIKPGFVDTNMTKDLDLPGILVAKPEKVASEIDNAINKGLGEIYTPKFWWIIMTIIKLIPEPIFKKLKF